jgi:pyruvate dehydrogenase E2 component (dihydrolipoamide acetyltransferase)
LLKTIVPEDQTVPVGTLIGFIGEKGENPDQVDMAAPTVRPQTPPLPAEHASPSMRDATEARIKASPLARKMAEEARIDLAEIKGTGPGRIVERDIEAAMTTTIRSAVSPNKIPLSPARQAIARHTIESKTKIPHFYVSIAINMTQPLKLREELNRESLDSEKISINDLIIAAAAQTLAKFPSFNASYRDDGLEMHPQINVGIAVALEDGLITPVLRDANKKSLKALAIELQAGDLGSGTFTVSNLGMFGVDEFSAIINPPEAAILAVGAVTQRPVVVDSAVGVAPMKVTLSVDHRVVDGAQAGRFLQEFKKLMENPTSLRRF